MFSILLLAGKLFPHVVTVLPSSPLPRNQAAECRRYSAFDSERSFRVNHSLAVRSRGFTPEACRQDSGLTRGVSEQHVQGGVEKHFFVSADKSSSSFSRSVFPAIATGRIRAELGDDFSQR